MRKKLYALTALAAAATTPILAGTASAAEAPPMPTNAQMPAGGLLGGVEGALANQGMQTQDDLAAQGSQTTHQAGLTASPHETGGNPDALSNLPVVGELTGGGDPVDGLPLVGDGGLPSLG